MRLEALENKVVILPSEKKDTSRGYLIPESQKKKVQTGTVVSVNGKTEMAKGDLVAFPPNTGIPMDLEGIEYRMAFITEIYAIIKD